VVCPRDVALRLLLAGAMSSLPAVGAAQPAAPRRVHAARAATAPVIDGRLDDRDPSAIVRQLSRRDVAVEADAFVVYLDPHHDHLTGAQFGVSAAGVQRDALICNDQFLDATWDAVWASAVSVDERGWVAEMRIPLSQLRFPKADRYTWGINVQRVIQRRNESGWLQLVRKNEAGLASRLAELEDIAGIAPPGTLELMPYVTARAEYIAPPVAGNPFNDGARALGTAGLDLKYGVTSSLTLDATFNPDFGQVEVDPAVVNLTQFEVFFEERGGCCTAASRGAGWTEARRPSRVCSAPSNGTTSAPTPHTSSSIRTRRACPAGRGRPISTSRAATSPPTSGSGA
jgi:hypothetical protein